MAILFSSSDDCRWPKIQFKKSEKMFFVSREFSRFVNFTYLQHFCYYFHHVYCFFDDFPIFWSYFCFLMLFWLSIFSSKINRWFSTKKWIINKSSKNQHIDQNNEKNIENNMILLFFIIIFPFCKNNLHKCFIKPFLGPVYDR